MTKNSILPKNSIKFIKAKVSLCLFIGASISLSLTAQANQISFSKTLQDGQYLFYYQWLDFEQTQQEIEFSIARKDVFNRYRDLGAYQPQLAQEYITNALKKHFKKNPVAGVTLNFDQQSDSLSFEIKSDDPMRIQEVSQQVRELEQSFRDTYLTKKYYNRFTTSDQVVAVKPDHGRIALESVADFKPLKPIIMEKASVKNIRKVTNYVLSFIQNIPYATLESRITASGVGFSPPLKLLWENQGDCDSKVTLAVSLLRTLMPRIRMALVYIDNHALIGIEVDIAKDDAVLSYQGVTYVLAEPTGPALLPLGSIAPESEQAVYSGHYSLEEFHQLAPQSENN